MEFENIEFTFELTKSEDGQKTIYISANDGASGAEYPYKTPSDIGRIITRYLTLYYPDIVEDCPLDTEEDM